MGDFVAHLTRQRAFSRATWGPGPRTGGVIAHIQEELNEIEAVYEADFPMDGLEDVHAAAAEEWVDVVILALDGLLRAVAEANPESHSDAVAMESVRLILEKQGKNEMRDWPDWRTRGQDEAINHVKTP